VGEVEDFEDFYRSEFPLIFRAALAFCGDREEALDSTQEAFARAYARWRRLRAEPWIGGWVMTTAMNICKRGFKAEERTRGLRPGSIHSSATVERVDIAAALRLLPTRQRQAATLHYIGDVPVAGVAGLMGISEGAVKSHLARAKEALRDSLEVADV
jgi:RNA polymerase sigma-70 factor (ECF subfamily)